MDGQTTLFEISTVTESKPAPVIYESEKKRCSKCREWKIYPEEFYGGHGYCKSCRCLYQKYRREKPQVREKMKFNAMRRNYGLTPEQYQAMLNKQNNLCKICGKPFEFTRLGRSANDPAIDHDHDTGLIRGIIHQHCNQQLGFLEGLLKKPKFIEQLSNYLGIPSPFDNNHGM